MTCTTHHDACECRQAKVDKAVMLLADALFRRLCVAEVGRSFGPATLDRIFATMRGYGVVPDDENGWRIE